LPKRLKEREIDMLHCGIDLASRASAVCLMTKDSEIVWEGECPTDEDGFRQVLKDHGALCCVIEASPLAEWTALILETLGQRSDRNRSA